MFHQDTTSPWIFHQMQSMRLPDFLPVHPGRTSPEPPPQNEDVQHFVELERLRRLRVEEELNSVCEALRVARAELREGEGASGGGACGGGAIGGGACGGASDYYGQAEAASCCGRGPGDHLDYEADETDPTATIIKLKNEIKKLQHLPRCLFVCLCRRRSGVCGPHGPTDLLSGVEQLKSLSSALDPT
ncbi:unnamed protein product [Leptidea sinapis]|uniref:Uncharacterized protein n=1 Tax=Leptidea sinapis TaxID=189913 RepID=A0A5E4PQH1_9NEOP|nr:unnamed protein product [Leptidea sinapis]